MEPLSKGYEHHEVEAKWYPIWRDKGYFKADDVSDKEPFCIVIPPPNVTGVLHMGHALTFAIQDAMVRFARMEGKNTLWLPGTDHAGIATQMVVERELAKEGVSRFDLGREKFLAEVWRWKDKSHARITEQMTALGVSVDWERERFTLDEGLSKAVRTVFVRLYEQGLVYRAQRMVNWSPEILTVLSDLEVEEKELKSNLWYIAYPVNGSDERLVVATTRPETIFGDTAVAVHPDDERYKHLIGKTVRLPLTDKDIPIIGDAEAVDPAFGTGALKITPGHDFSDFETGQRNNLPVISIMTPDAHLNDNVPAAYRGMERFAARAKTVADLEEQGFLIKIEPYTHMVGHCQRSGVVVEPTVSMQWFVKTKPLAEPAIQAVLDKKTVFIPASWEKTYMNWMENIRDWCISRQLWWGHRVPVWYCTKPDCDGMIVALEDPAPGTACPKCGCTELHQDDDVLDTWFSSALWPFSTLGWPQQTDALKTFYPTTIMETGFDILFFWVARMMMMGIHFMGDVPFYTVYLHAMVRDQHGLKMSKTKGNVIDPLEIVEEVGADALRYTLVTMAAQGRDVKLSIDRIRGYREFVNKLWNASRFVFMNLEDLDEGAVELPKDDDLAPADRWILTRLGDAMLESRTAFAEHRFNDAATLLYHFVWHQFCDWYLELSKGALAEGGQRRKTTQAVLVTVLDQCLRAMHPLAPYVTEELWQRLRPFLGATPESIMIASYPTGAGIPVFAADALAMDEVLDVISAIRGVRAQVGLPPSQAVDVVVKPHESDVGARLLANADDISRLGRLANLTINENATRPAGAAVTIGTKADCYVVVGDERLAAEIVRLNKERERAVKELTGVERKLSNPQFLEKANPDVVEGEREKSEELTAAIARLDEALAALG
jgi:valyl-tRNA synthetase